MKAHPLTTPSKGGRDRPNHLVAFSWNGWSPSSGTAGRHRWNAQEPGRRNEALDCRVYARAAAAICGLDRFEERHWRRMEAALARSADGEEQESVSRAASVRPPARRVIHSGYMAR